MARVANALERSLIDSSDFLLEDILYPVVPMGLEQINKVFSKEMKGSQ